MTNALIVFLKITVTIVCFLIGVVVGILEMLFFDNRRQNLDN